MTLHLRAAHASQNFRSDVRANFSRMSKMTDELRAEIERDRPLLHWPMKSQKQGGARG